MYAIEQVDGIGEQAESAAGILDDVRSWETDRIADAIFGESWHTPRIDGLRVLLK